MSNENVIDLETILVVDDDEVFRARLVRAFSDREYKVFSAACCEDAVEIGKAEAPDYAVFDLRLGERTGLDLLEEFAKVSPSTRVLMLTGYGSIPTAINAVRLGAVNYLTKPADADAILRALHEPANLVQEIAVSSAPSLARTEWEHIQRVLADCDGNISHAAEVLGIARRSLQRKLAKLPPRV